MTKAPSSVALLYLILYVLLGNVCSVTTQGLSSPTRKRAPTDDNNNTRMSSVHVVFSVVLNAEMSRKVKEEYYRFFSDSDHRTHEKGHTEYKVTARVGLVSVSVIKPSRLSSKAFGLTCCNVG